MKNRIFTILLPAVFILVLGASAWADTDPFTPLTAFVAAEGGWAMSHAGQAKVFNAVRAKLGKRFEKELLAFTDSDLNRIYWCGCFLIDEDYLAGNKPLPALALSIFEKGLAVKTNPASPLPAEMNAAADRATIEIVAAVLSFKLGRKDKAAKYKAEVKRLFEKYPDYEGAFPAMSEEDNLIYDSL